jgi:DNA-binding transcriptional LysR family regulator
MSVAKYQVFLKTVECGSFTAAAREMNFTQSGVSHAIGSLEEELGVPLLIRSHGGVTPTADGRALLPYFEKMCAMQHQLEQQAADLRGLETGLVKVATFTSVSEKWLPNILKTFQTHYPHIEFELLPSNFNNEIGDWVLNGQADCGFISLPAPVEKYLDCWLLQRDQWKVIVPCDHPYADRDPFPVSALATEPFIQLEEGDDYEIMAAFDEMGIRPNVKYIAREDRTILAMVSEGLGISLLPELMVRHSPTPIRICRAPLHFYRTIGIGIKDKKALSNSTRLFVDYVRTWVAENGER